MLWFVWCCDGLSWEELWYSGDVFRIWKFSGKVWIYWNGSVLVWRLKAFQRIYELRWRFVVWPCYLELVSSSKLSCSVLSLATDMYMNVYKLHYCSYYVPLCFDCVVDPTDSSSFWGFVLLISGSICSSLGPFGLVWSYCCFFLLLQGSFVLGLETFF